MISKYILPALLTLTAIAGAYAPQTAIAQNTVDRVAAVVNENVISYRDFKDRMAFTLKNMRAKPTGKQLKELEDAQMQDLIDEELLRQYAKENNYTVEEEQIKTTIANMEKSSNQKPGSFKQFAGQYYPTAEAQVKTNVLRQMIADRSLRYRITIGEDEVNRILKSIIARQDELDEKQLAQIFIPVTEENKASAARSTIERLSSQLSSGADFADLARTYSRDRSATNGGEIGWFRGGELIPVIDNAVRDLGKGQVSPPVQSANGWHIFKVLDVREAPKPDMTPTTEVNITQLYAPIDTTSGTPAKVQNKKHMENFNKIKKGIDSKEEFTEIVTTKIAESPLYFASGEMGWVNLESLDTSLKAALKDAKEGQIVGPVSGEKGVYLFYVNGARETEPAALKNIRDRIRERLEARQIDLAFRSLLRDLRRKAFIDIRL